MSVAAANPARGDLLVIGAGLAGAATAAAAAEHGLGVVLVADPGVTAASAVPLALMAPYPTRAQDPLTHLRNRGAALTRSWLHRLHRQELDSGLRAEGVLLIPARPRDRQRRERLKENRWVRRLTEEQAHAASGVRPPEASVFHAAGGCVDPGAFVTALLRSAAEHVSHVDVRTVNLTRDSGRWQARDAAGAVRAEAPVVVVAAGTGSAAVSELAQQHLTPLRGQASAVAATSITSALRCPISHGGYVLPAVDGVHWTGASATRNDRDPMPRDADDQDNLARMAALWPGIEPLRVVDRFVAIRATTGSRLPLIGAEAPGLWLNTGHGSHGLLTAPIAGRMIARAIAAGYEDPMLLRHAPFSGACSTAEQDALT